MSTCGATLRGDKNGSPLSTTRWTTQGKAIGSSISIDLYHLTLETALKSRGLMEYLRSMFARVVEEGRTYPRKRPKGRPILGRLLRVISLLPKLPLMSLLVKEMETECRPSG